MEKKGKTKKKSPHAVVLTDTFFNRHLLQQNPFKLREDLIMGRAKGDGWAIVENLLWAIEHEAEFVLKEKPQLEDPLGTPFTEADLLDKYELAELPHDQANAIAALRSIQQIRKEFRFRKVHGQYILDGVERGFDQIYDSRTVAKLVLETALLIMAAFRGDFWGKYWDHIVRGKRSLDGARNKRSDRLNQVILRVLKRHGPKQSALRILASLEKLEPDLLQIDSKDVVYEITDKNGVSWWDQRGVAKLTSFHAFEKRVSKLKKQLLAK